MWRVFLLKISRYIRDRVEHLFLQNNYIYTLVAPWIFPIFVLIFFNQSKMVAIAIDLKFEALYACSEWQCSVSYYIKFLKTSVLDALFPITSNFWKHLCYRCSVSYYIKFLKASVLDYIFLIESLEAWNNLFHMKITASVKKARGLCYSHWPIFSYTNTLFLCLNSWPDSSVG